MSPTDNDIDWSLTSWEGSRRAQLRRWLALTVRERLQAIEEMVELSARIAGSLRPSERNAPTDIPASAADTGRAFPDRSGVLPRVDHGRRKLGVRLAQLEVLDTDEDTYTQAAEERRYSTAMGKAF